MTLRTKFIRKMKANIVLLAFIFFCIGGNAQNLVPNPSFELHTVSCSSMVPGGGGVTSWISPVINSTSSFAYANSCSINPCCGVPLNTFGRSYQNAHRGNGYVGFFAVVDDGFNIDSRNYVQTKLISSLKLNNCYYVEFFINLNDYHIVGCNNVGLLFGDTAIISNKSKYVSANPQIQQYGNPVIIDTMNWVRIAGIYTAHGGEQYITIGNFKDDVHTDTISIQKIGNQGAGYFLDDVSVIPLDSMQLKADAGRDTTIVKGDSLWIGSRLCGLTNVVWYDAANNVIDTGAPGLWVKPTSNTFYVIEQNVCGQYSRDTVYVNVQPLPVTLLSFNVLGFKSFNGNTNTVLSWETASEVNVSHFNVQRSVDGVTFETVGTVKSKGASKYSFVDNTNLSGVVHYRLEIVDKNGSKSYSEIRELSISHSTLFITPNPAKDFITIHGGDIKEIGITDISGRILILSKEKRVDISKLSIGTYCISIKTKDGQYKLQKLVKL